MTLIYYYQETKFKDNNEKKPNLTNIKRYQQKKNYQNNLKANFSLLFILNTMAIQRRIMLYIIILTLLVDC